MGYITLLLGIFLSNAIGQDNEFPVSSYGFLIEAFAPLPKESIMERVPDDLRSLSWKLTSVDEQKHVYELKLDNTVNLNPKIFWDTSYAIREIELVQFCDPLFIPLEETLKYRLYFSPKNAFGDGLFGSCSWPKSEQSAYLLGGKQYCFPYSSDPFEWVDKKFLHFKKSWEFSGTRGKGILIAQPDSGYHHHPEIVENILIEKSVNFTAGKAEKKNTLDSLEGQEGHGTSTASLISSPPGKQSYPYSPEHLEVYGPDPQNAPFVEGVAPEAKIIPYRVTGGNVVQFSFLQLSKSIHQSIKDNVGVISISLGGPLPMPWLHRAIKKANDQGIIVVAAAGNYIPKFSFKKFVVWPARYPEVVAVSASDSDGKVWRHSSYGKQVDITAPGVGTWVASVRSHEKQVLYEVERSYGTSYSASYVAGSAALFLSHHGHDNLKKAYGPKNVGKLFQYMLKNHGYNRPVGWKTKRYGPGILDVYKLISAPLPGPQFFLRKRHSSPHTLALNTFVNFLPQVSKTHVKKNLKELFHISSDRKLELALNTFGHELKFHLTRHPSLLEGLLSLSSSSMRGKKLSSFYQRLQKLNLSQRLQNQFKLASKGPL